MAVLSAISTLLGSPLPFGSSYSEGSWNFSLSCSRAKKVQLVLYKYRKRQGVAKEIQTITLDPNENRTADIWHVKVSSTIDPLLYGYRIDDGPLLLDPYAKEIWSGNVWGKPEHLHDGQNRFYSPLGLCRKNDGFDWQGVESPHLDLKSLIIYEMHIRGFTNSVNSQVTHPGTFLGVVEKIPYLKNLGINAVELMPLYEFNELQYLRTFLTTRSDLLNYWGYSPLSFMAPMNRYSSSREPGAASDECKLMIRELHNNKIEVILDVVYNHTGEEGALGPNYSFKGIDPEIYYLIDQEGNFKDFSGCGNTVNCNHPQVIELIIASLRHWVINYKIDGFRFDLASIMTRDVHGTPLEKPPLIEAINADPILSQTKLIAEPWDAAGLYHVGCFPSHTDRWAEWNGKYRDEVRQFIKGSEGFKNRFATRISGSEDIYSFQRNPFHSINFITCHDGFTLHDLVSYQDKHNENNGENNLDGANDNFSWNCGEEGDTLDTKINKLRIRQIKNFIATLFLSQGVPLIRMGDEVGLTQKGNNNSWCQDNEISWLDWDLFQKNQEIFRFFRLMVQFRKEHSVLRKGHFLTNNDIEWHGDKPLEPKWDKDNKLVVLTYKNHDKKGDLYLAFNAYHNKRKLLLPKPKGNQIWHKKIDTSQNAPNDFSTDVKSELIKEGYLFVKPYSVIVLKSK